jgi:hypothetical protein
MQPDEKPFKGEIYPTFFKVKGTAYGEKHKRECPINYRMRLAFETNARDDYFSRRIESGKFSMTWTDKADTEHRMSVVGPTLRSGLATVMMALPDGVGAGDVLTMTAVTEDTRSTFKNVFEVTVPRVWPTTPPTALIDVKSLQSCEGPSSFKRQSRPECRSRDQDRGPRAPD